MLGEEIDQLLDLSQVLLPLLQSCGWTTLQRPIL